jgi:hypothetical protein
MKFWQKGLSILFPIVLSVMSARPAIAVPTETPKPAEEACPEAWQKRQPYVRIVTKQGDPLRVRSAPNGAVIGAIPSGWAVVPVRRDRTGRWLRITSHFGEVTEKDMPYGFGSAPHFRTGWVSAQFVKNLGTFCEKPQEVSQLQQTDLVADQDILVQEDWLALGDRIAQLNAN